MLEMIATLEKKGLAYRSSNGDVNFAVRKFPGYGKLSGKSLDQLRAGERVAVLDGKDDPLDFVMWKAAKESEPDDAKWPSAYGPGRPGWHIECSAMCKALLGEHFDIHGGGQDLQFPHHENEIAQSEGASGGPFVNVWMHNGLLNIDNEKMSKSLGNFFTIRDVLKRFDGETIRFFMLRTHYRSPVNFSDAHLDDAKQRAAPALHRARRGCRSTHRPWSTGATARAAAFRAAMNDDFNTPIAVAVLFELAGEVNRSKSASDAALAEGPGRDARRAAAAAARLPAGRRGPRRGRIAALIEERRAAKARGDFAALGRDPQRARRPGHRPQGHRAGHDLGEGLIVPSAAEPVPVADFWDDACKHLVKRDRVMKKLIPRLGDGRLESRGDAFTTLARSIVGQQISVKAAQAVWDRFVALTAGPSHRLAPHAVLALDAPHIRAAGLSARKVEYLCDLAEHFESGAVHAGAVARRWTTRRSSRSWSASAASAAGPPRCS